MKSIHAKEILSIRTLLFLMMSFVCCAEQNILQPLLPEDLIVGEPMNTTCFLDVNSSLFKENTYNSSDVYLEIDGKVVNRSCTEILNISHIRINCSSTTPSTGTWVKCFVKKRNENYYLASNSVLIGYRPKSVKFTEVIVFNWTSLSIAWQKAENPVYETDVTVWWRLLNDTTFRMCTEQKKWTEKGKVYGVCSARLKDASWNSKVIFQIKANNTVGKYETNHLAFYVYSKVKPEIVKKLQVSAVSPESVSLEWEPPTFYQSLICDISYRNQWEDLHRVKSIEINEYEMYGKQTSILKDLEAYTEYNISIVCKSSRGGFWSDPAILAIKTAPTVPRAEPVVTNGCYFMTRTSKTTRKITIYWQRLPQRTLQGPIKEYRVRYEKNGYLETVVVPPDEHNWTIENLNQYDEFDVFVDVSTVVGYNSTAQTMLLTIPPLSSGDDENVKMVVKAFRDDLVNVNFVRRSKTASNYTIFWCEQSGSQTCMTELQWMIVPDASLSYNITLPKYYIEYQFGFAVEGENGNQGINWEDCRYDDRRNPDPPEITEVADITTTSMTIWLRRPNCRFRPKGYVRYYKVIWCQVTKNNKDACNEDSHNKIADAIDNHLVSISRLKPGTEYRIEAYSIADTGRESYNPTYRVKQTSTPIGGFPLSLVIGLGLPVLVLFIFGLVAICRYGYDVRKWFTSFKVSVADPISDKEESVCAEPQLDSDFESDLMHPVYLTSDNAYAPVIDYLDEKKNFDIEDERKRLHPDGASNILDDTVAYKKCHYKLSPKTRKKIKKTSKRPNQIYLDRTRTINENMRSNEREERKTKITCDKMEDFNLGKDRNDDAAVESDSLLLSQISSDYPGGWSDAATLPRVSVESLHDVSSDDEVEVEKMTISIDKPKPFGGDESKVVVGERDGDVPGASHESDWDSSDEDDNEGYQKRANEIEQVFVDSEEDEEMEDEKLETAFHC